MDKAKFCCEKIEYIKQEALLKAPKEGMIYGKNGMVAMNTHIKTRKEIFHRFLNAKSTDQIEAYQDNLNFKLSDGAIQILTCCNGMDLYSFNICVMGIADATVRDIDKYIWYPLDIYNVNFARPALSRAFRGNIVASLFQNEFFIIDGADGVVIYDQETNSNTKSTYNIINILSRAASIIGSYYDNNGKNVRTFESRDIVGSICY